MVITDCDSTERNDPRGATDSVRTEEESSSGVVVRGRRFAREEIEMMRELIRSHPELSRRAISLLVCERLDWRQPNGRLKDRACRVVLLRMHERGILELPPPRIAWRRKPSEGRRQRALPLYVPVERPLDALGPIELILCNRDRTAAHTDVQEATWNELIDRHHFLGYRSIVGPQLKYLAVGSEGILGAIGFGPAFARIRVRDEWIGWEEARRKENLQHVINQVRFLIVPWIRTKNLASHLLALSTRRVVSDWQRRYGVRPLLIETFVHPERHRGTCYRASSWELLGRTAGYGKPSPEARPTKTPKLVFVKPLTHRCRRDLCRLRSEIERGGRG